MFFVISGEGASDIGNCNNGAHECNDGEFNIGPVSIVVDQIFESRSGYSFLDSECYTFVRKSRLVEIAKQFKIPKKRPRLPGLKKKKETAYFYRNARALAQYARAKMEELNDDVVAVLFRDSDGAASSGRGHWADKVQSMHDGFKAENFDRGVPMVLKPKSEAWILCALKDDPYVACNQLEEYSGSDKAPNALKKALEKTIGEKPSSTELRQMLEECTINVNRIDMNSFNVFRVRLEEVV